MNILQLTNYPTVNPMHGGQIRSRMIADNLKHHGYKVRSLAIFLDEDFSDRAPWDIPLHKNPDLFRQDLSFLGDYLLACELRTNSEANDQIEQFVGPTQPDVIIFEQPWLFETAHRLAQGASRLIYSSQNIEWRLKENHTSSHTYDLATIDEIKDLERRAVQSSDLTIACTDSDALELSQLGGVDISRVIVCGNGVSPFVCDEYDVERWSDYFAENIGFPYPVFVSSGHPPNATGFWKLLAPGLTFLRPREQILVIGGVCNLLTTADGIASYRHLNLSRLHLAGRQPLQDLQAMVRSSHVVLLPIETGEGSNLKTAEALESGCWVVGTTKAFRGYENALSLPHVHIADNAPEFRRMIRHVLNTPRNVNVTPDEIRKGNYWERKLAPLSTAILALTRIPSKQVGSILA